MEKEKLKELLRIAYRWGRDNGTTRSEKNFNDLLDTKAIKEQLSIADVVGKSEQLCECYGTHIINEVEVKEICIRCRKPTT